MRASKRPRLSAMDSSEDETQQMGPRAAIASRTRASSACEKCRSRKTKCDNLRPSCSYCSKHAIPCVYPDDTLASPCAETGAQILHAIGKLSDLVERQQSRCSSCLRAPSQDSTSQHRASGCSFNLPWSPSARTNNSSLLVGANSVNAFGKQGQLSFQPQGIEAILSWDVFTQYQPRECLFASRDSAISSNMPLPSIDLEELRRLEVRYVNGVHSKNPILDLSELHGQILHVAENGFDWSTGTCLVTLVCAIGAINQQYQDQHLSSDDSLTPGAPQVVTPSSSNAGAHHLSLQFWSVAARRLGFVVGQNDLRAAQCLCLAGIWYMHQMEPLQAWKYFSLAGSVWYSVNLINDASDEEISSRNREGTFTAMQALYFTIWKSMCELRIELDVPGVFDQVGFPHDFPTAPNDWKIDSPTGSDSHERSWYYYLAEIAARHQINRIASALSWTSAVPTTTDLRRMLNLAEMMEKQVQEWHSSLPTVFHFEVPDGYTLAPHPDDMTQILRHRYLTCRELIGRPFVKLCVETPLNYEEPLRERVLSLASRCLQYCMLKLSQVAPHRHQGTWFTIRNAAASILVLSTVDLAHREFPLSGAQELLLPDDWLARALHTVEILRPFWYDHRGGASNIGVVIQSVLAKCMTEVDQLT